ncbi:NADH dehydrogenase [ubiquinone] 1 subunit C2 [Falco biarmicus]|uniref:NADH dehydrogenase [ubiquinone] 1 subunit C2 n=1 Tax=Falco rusticolus TaxID=120794 RepID=UPI001886786C|nr:NADH dehydrogenase [ubiquinone] 1 subunit C2 [Falco rusticolus]XP_055559224.1 NADH dehydrogenase [ubiquinone] 1 subunit C2 [Falco cherrug]XP_055659085.1 NADH dehydrogenase [ubiquinone] 1 subunit C2 [Falco peregrinus]XP_056183002.1 NADH dehydrogenase [ubiquinone] 1 subunit C2 [Falco biarmicus]
MLFLPDEARSLPPPPLVNKGSVWLGLTGWVSALLDNSFNHRPVIRAGVHRQILFSTVGWFVGYYLIKRTEYLHAKLDRELFEYVRQHPEDFKTAEKKRIGELLEDFHPIR